MRLPRPVIYADSVSIPAGGTVTLFEEVSPIVRVGTKRIPLKTTLKRFSVDRVSGVWLERYINEERQGTRISAYACPGLDFWVDDLNMVAHADEEIKWTATNENTADVTLAYRFYLEQEEDDGIPIKQHIWQNTLTISALASNVKLAEFRAREGRVVIVYSIATDRNSNIRIFARLNERIITPTDGFNCGASRGIERDMKVSYIVEPGDQLEFTATNSADSIQTFNYRILALEVPVEHEAEFGIKTIEEELEIPGVEEVPELTEITPEEVT